jgi:phenylpyruvate tautomerase PptA (4-oxalocrotonate tautomerase family)
MPQAIIHISETPDQGAKSALVKEVRQAISKVLELEDTIGQVLLYTSPVANRITHAGRDSNFVFVEVFMYPGREPALKNELMDRISMLVNRYMNINPQDIHGVIHEIPKENYFGGIKKQH